MALACYLHAKMIVLGPNIASSVAEANPIPELHPVITMTLLERSGLH